MNIGIGKTEQCKHVSAPDLIFSCKGSGGSRYYVTASYGHGDEQL